MLTYLRYTETTQGTLVAKHRYSSLTKYGKMRTVIRQSYASRYQSPFSQEDHIKLIQKEDWSCRNNGFLNPVQIKSPVQNEELIHIATSEPIFSFIVHCHGD